MYLDILGMFLSFVSICTKSNSLKKKEIRNNKTEES